MVGKGRHTNCPFPCLCPLVYGSPLYICLTVSHPSPSTLSLHSHTSSLFSVSFILLYYCPPANPCFHIPLCPFLFLFSSHLGLPYSLSFTFNLPPASSLAVSPCLYFSFFLFMFLLALFLSLLPPLLIALICSLFFHTYIHIPSSLPHRN